jgi:TonB family protein
MELFAAPYMKLIDQPMSEVKPVRYEARDGLSIPGYLTLPRGREAKGLPLIVMPHGGPFVRDRYAFDPMVQLLASRGYAVLQPNFRGSTGYGRDYVEKGYGQMGLKMQDDLDDGVAWLAGDGTVDPKRVCILGSSYGGYAALWGAIRNPEIYRCAVSFAGVTDVAGILKYDSKFLLARRYFKQHRKKIEGEQKRDLAAVSPLQQADRLKVPVLIAHGEQDSTVPADQSRKLVAVLKARGAPVQSAFYSEAAHGFSSSAESLDFMKRVEAFLELHNPADPAAAKGPREAQLVAGSIEGAQLLSQSRKKPARNAVDLRYRITADGRVTSCTIEKSSGIEAIDKHACALAEQQFQYRPAVSPAGERQESWTTHAVTWQPPAKK